MLLSTYACHPSMANNELSGPVVTTYLARWLMSAPRRYTYRVVIVPETIGSVAYLDRHLEHLRRNVVAGFVITCVGDDRVYSYLPSRRGRHPGRPRRAQRAPARAPGLHPLLVPRPRQRRAPVLQPRGRPAGLQRDAEQVPGVPRVPHLRSTTPAWSRRPGCGGAFEALRDILTVIEGNRRYRTTTVGEPQLGKRGLYPQLSLKHSADSARDMVNLLAYADGESDLIEISDTIGVGALDLLPIVDRLRGAGLLDVRDPLIRRPGVAGNRPLYLGLAV